MRKLVDLRIVDINTGFCQITYKTKNDLGQYIYYGLQDNGDKHGGVRLMRCTPDFEPEYEIKNIKPEYEFNFELPVGNYDLAKKCRKFIENFGHTNNEEVQS